MESLPGLVAAQRGFADGTLQPGAYLADCRARAEACEPWLHAFARFAASETLDPRAPGPLGGIPVGVKDIIDTAGLGTEYGCAAFAGHVPDRDAEAVIRLRALGGMVFGKTVTTEFAFRTPGPTVNPWNRLHTPGGSSSGSAAAVAAGIVPLAFGTQTLGSILRPAAFCGVVGFKPSFGRLPLAGVHPLAPSLDHLGLFARAVEDVAEAFRLLARTPAEPFSEKRPPRLAMMTGSFPDAMGPAQRRRLGEAAALLREAGARVEEVPLPAAFDAANEQARCVLAVEAAEIFVSVLATRAGVSERLAALVAEGRTMDRNAYNAAREAQARLRACLRDLLAGYDAALTVPATGEAPAGLDDTGDASCCAPWTFIGVPAIALPAGLGPGGLPLGVQLVGQEGEDAVLLDLALWCERSLQLMP